MPHQLNLLKLCLCHGYGMCATLPACLLTPFMIQNYDQSLAIRHDPLNKSKYIHAFSSAYNAFTSGQRHSVNATLVFKKS